jgi:hypothetical protein
LRIKLSVEFRKISPHARYHLFLEGVALFEKFGDCQLHGRVHG